MYPLELFMWWNDVDSYQTSVIYWESYASFDQVLKISFTKCIRTYKAFNGQVHYWQITYLFVVNQYPLLRVFADLPKTLIYYKLNQEALKLFITILFFVNFIKSFFTSFIYKINRSLIISRDLEKSRCAFSF